jgi:hypothetical protein
MLTNAGHPGLHMRVYGFSLSQNMREAIRSSLGHFRRGYFINLFAAHIPLFRQVERLLKSGNSSHKSGVEVAFTNKN